MGKSLTTITANPDFYAFIFGQRGLMAGIGIRGNKITRLTRQLGVRIGRPVIR